MATATLCTMRSAETGTPTLAAALRLFALSGLRAAELAAFEGESQPWGDRSCHHLDHWSLQGLMAAIESSVKKPAREPLAKLFTKLYSEQLLSCEEFAMGCAATDVSHSGTIDARCTNGVRSFAFAHLRRITLELSSRMA